MLHHLVRLEQAVLAVLSTFDFSPPNERRRPSPHDDSRHGLAAPAVRLAAKDSSINSSR